MGTSEDHGTEDTRIGLKEAISVLRSELSESMKDSAANELRFEVGEIALQFQVEVQRVSEGKAGIRFWVVDVTAGGSRTSTTTHVITVPLTPVMRDGSPVLTGSGAAPDAS